MANWTPTRSASVSSTSSSRTANGGLSYSNRAYQTAFESTTPVSVRRAGIASPAKASPQVRERLAELRRAKQAAAAAAAAKDATGLNNSQDGSENSRMLLLEQDDIQISHSSDSRRPSSSLSTLSLDRNSVPARTPSPAASEVTIELGIRTLKEEVDKAKRSGRLNISGRSLEQFPPLVLEQLLSRDSIYYPSNVGPVNDLSSLTDKTGDLDISGSATTSTPGEDEDVDTSSPRWWEVESLTTLKASNNELASVPASLAGFDTLQVLDLHANQLASPFPASFGTLVNLTSLNLSKNAIKDWPIELMSLVHLKELDLSHNRLQRLWDLEWKMDIKGRLKNVKKDAKRVARRGRAGENGDSSFDSIDSESTAPDSSVGEDFWSAYNTAPVKTRALAYNPTQVDKDYSSPLPSLMKLNLSHNRISMNAFSTSNIESLPPYLTSLDLSDNGISGRISLDLFGVLSHLKHLNLANNGLDDDFFIPSSSPSTSQSSLLPQLESLDLSRNALDSLEHLEQSLDIPVARGVQYKGTSSPSLVKLFASVMDPTSPKVPTLSINLSENLLREELARRKKAKRDKRAPADDTASNPPTNQHSQMSGTEKEQQADEQDLLELLTQVHQRIVRRVQEGALHSGQIRQLREGLRTLDNLAAVEPDASSASSRTSKAADRFPMNVVPHIQETSTPIRPPAIAFTGSSRARRQKLEEEARSQWDPL